MHRGRCILTCDSRAASAIIFSAGHACRYSTVFAKLAQWSIPLIHQYATFVWELTQLRQLGLSLLHYSTHVTSSHWCGGIRMVAMVRSSVPLQCTLCTMAELKMPLRRRREWSSTDHAALRGPLLATSAPHQPALQSRTRSGRFTERTRQLHSAIHPERPRAYLQHERRCRGRRVRHDAGDGFKLVCIKAAHLPLFWGGQQQRRVLLVIGTG